MTHPAPSVEELYRSLLRARSGEERLHMAGDMFDTARQLVLASVPGASPAESACHLFLRFYGNDFPPSARDAILARLRSFHQE